MSNNAAVKEAANRLAAISQTIDSEMRCLVIMYDPAEGAGAIAVQSTESEEVVDEFLTQSACALVDLIDERRAVPEAS